MLLNGLLIGAGVPSVGETEEVAGDGGRLYPKDNKSKSYLVTNSSKIVTSINLLILACMNMDFKL